MKDRAWAISVAVTAATVAASLWLWFGPWLWNGIPWLVAMGLPFLVGLLAPRLPLVFGVLPALLPYLLEGDVKAPLVLGALGASYVAIAAGMLIRRFAGGWRR